MIFFRNLTLQRAAVFCIALIVGDAEVELLPDDLMLFYGYFWQILANPGYFLATVWLILATLG